MNQRLSFSLSVFRGRLMRAAGLSIAAVPLMMACTAEVIVIDPGSGSGGATTATSSSSVGTTVTSSTTTTPTTTGVGGNAPTSGTGVGGGSGTHLDCFEVADHLPCPSLEDAPKVFPPCSQNGNWIDSWQSGPHIKDGLCCYEVIATEVCGIGRPFIEAKEALLAPLSATKAWLHPDQPSTEAASDDSLSIELRADLAQSWLQDALHEHASIASFARFSLELMAADAPPALIEAAHQAALDEAEHARLCFALAARYSNEAMGPGRFPLPTHVELRSDLVSLATATAQEGCLGETLAAALASEQARQAVDPQARQALERIASDEARHAELAWQTVAWALREGGDDVREAVQAVFEKAHQALLPVAVCEQAGGLEHGRLTAAASDAVQRQTLNEVVLPCAMALLAETEKSGAVQDRANAGSARSQELA